jgi:hypothetical protein
LYGSVLRAATVDRAMSSAKEFREYARECMRLGSHGPIRKGSVRSSSKWHKRGWPQQLGMSRNGQQPQNPNLGRSKVILALANETPVLPFGGAVGFSGQPLDAFAVEHNDLISAGIY